MPDRLKNPLKGGCQCGQFRYTISKAPKTLYCCHCTECQSQSASAFGMSLRVDASGVELQGQFASYWRDAEQITAVECLFCPQCGSRVAHRGRGASSGMSIKAGSLDDKRGLEPVGHIWVDSAHQWLRLGGLTYAKQPNDHYAALSEAFRQRYGDRFE